eukprot:g3727.t1
MEDESNPFLLGVIFTADDEDSGVAPLELIRSAEDLKATALPVEQSASTAAGAAPSPKHAEGEVSSASAVSSGQQLQFAKAATTSNKRLSRQSSESSSGSDSSDSTLNVKPLPKTIPDQIFWVAVTDYFGAGVGEKEGSTRSKGELGLLLQKFKDEADKAPYEQTQQVAQKVESMMFQVPDLVLKKWKDPTVSKFDAVAFSVRMLYYVCTALLIYKKCKTGSFASVGPGNFSLGATLRDTFAVVKEAAVVDSRGAQINQQADKAKGKKRDGLGSAEDGVTIANGPATALELQTSITQALGKDMLSTISRIAETVKQRSVAESTENSYMSVVRSAMKLCGFSDLALPITTSYEHILFMVSVFVRAGQRDDYCVVDEQQKRKVKYSYLARVRAAVAYYHKIKTPHVDFAIITGTQDVTSTWAGLKRLSHHEKEKKEKPTMSLRDLVDVSDAIARLDKKMWRRKNGSIKAIESKDWSALGYSFKKEAKNSLKEFFCHVRTLLALRVGILGERRKSELMETSSVQAGSMRDRKGSLVVSVVSSKTDFSRKRISDGKNFVVPGIDALEPSPWELKSTMMELQSSYFIKSEKLKYEAPVLSWGQMDFTAPPCDMDAISSSHEVHTKTAPVYMFPTLGNDHTFRKLEPQAFNAYLQAVLHKKLSMQARFPNPQPISLRASGAKIYAQFSRELAVKQGGWTTDRMLNDRYAPVTDEQLLIGTQRALDLGVEVNLISEVAMELVAAKESQKQVEWLVKKRQAFRVDFCLKTVQGAWNMFNLQTRNRLALIKWKDSIDKSRENSDWHSVVASTADAYALARHVSEVLAKAI